MFYLGIDVAKAKLDCSLILDPATHKRKSKIVPNTRSGLATLILMSIPAIGLRTGICLLTILHSQRFRTAEQMVAYLAIWVWCPLSGSPAVLYRVVHAYPKPGLPGFERFYTWPLSLLKRIMLMSRRFTKNGWDAVNQKCQPWGPLCASLSICAWV